MLTIDNQASTPASNYGVPVLRLGFRPFFLAAGIYAIFTMAIWMLQYVFSIDVNFSWLSPALWHAHEMIFGYAMAVVAGFLLTAIKNWTGMEVLRGRALAILFFIWLLARVLPFTGNLWPIAVHATIDVSFLILLTLACLRPVLKVRQYKQAGIISKLLLLMLCNIVFYLGVSGVLADGVQWGLSSAMYIIIALILVMLRRVMPMFIQNGIDGEADITNHTWLDISSLVLLVCLWLLDVFTGYDMITASAAAMLALLHLLRLSGWFTVKVWNKPLLWVLVLAYAAIISGFALKSLEYAIGISPFISLHAFTVGGIGLVTIGMMSRVSLGHTGRNVFEPPAIITWSFLLLLVAAIIRVIFPLFNMELYVYWIAISQFAWITAFAVFVYVYAPMLLRARVDGRDG